MIVAVTSEKDLETETTDEKPADEAVGEAEETDDAEESETEASVEELDEDAEDLEDDDEDAGDEDEDDRPLKGKRDKAKDVTWRSRPWGQYLRRSALPLLLAAALLVSGFLGWKQWQAHQLNEAGEQARQAAIAYAGVLTSIDSNNVDQNFRQVLDGATGEFKDMYTQSSVQLRQLLIDNKATAHGVVVDSAIASESMGKVVVLLFIDQTVTNAQVPDPRIDRSRIKITMEKIDGRWKASKVQLL
jgi:Mce-associated membrane protein